MFASQDWHEVDVWLYNWNYDIAGVVTDRGSNELVSRGKMAGPRQHGNRAIIITHTVQEGLGEFVAPKCPSYMLR
jgi:hypothetical protein